MKSIWGMVTVRAKGDEIERFLNLSVHKDMVIQDITQDDEGICFRMRVRDYLKLKTLLRKTHTRTVLLRKSGLPFFCMRIRKRAIFWGMGFLCMLLLMITLTKIWHIEISGNKTISFDRFYDFLQMNHIGYGTESDSIDYKSLEASIREYFPQVTWASVTLKGTGLYIHVKEDTDSYPVTTHEYENSHLTATRTGTVVSMVVREGISLVAVGDEVETGEILVEGKIPVLNADLTLKTELLVNADADITLRYTDEIALNLQEQYKKKVYTGETERNYCIQFGSFRLWNPFRDNSYKESESVTRIKQLRLIDNYYLPVFWGRETSREYRMEEAVYSESEAEEILLGRLQEILQSLEQKGVQIIEKDVNISYRGNRYYLNCQLLCEEQAIQSVPIEDDNTGI